MNNTTIGIILVATTVVMIIASTNLTPMIQHRQGYAASPTASLKDNLRANLGNRNQHLNQQGNCIRTDGCATSDVGQGTLGNDNSVTGFTDQSTINTTTANAATPGPAGAKGDPGTQGAKGDPGAQGAVGSAGPPRKLVVTERRGDEVTVGAFDVGEATANCNTGEFATGGGWNTSLDFSHPPIVQTSQALLGKPGWVVNLFNPSSGPEFLHAFVECASLVP